MIQNMGERARLASRKFSLTPTELKNKTLLDLADAILTSSATILSANAKDVEDGVSAGLNSAMIDRLTLNTARLESIASDLCSVAALLDPVGEIFDANTLANGLQVKKQRVPIGVIGVIYEARPNVTMDVAGLVIKTGNTVILRGGSETMRSNRALVSVIRHVLAANGLPSDVVQFIDDPDRALVSEMLNLHQYIDMLIPRGGAALHQFCRENSRIPVITGGIGICHLFLDETADIEAAIKVIHNAKVQRPTVCNALDTVLIHRSCAASFLPEFVRDLRQAGVSFRCDPSAIPYLIGISESQSARKGVLPTDILPAGAQDFDTEWLSLVLGIKVVDSLEEAIEHIQLHSTGHSDGILTRNEANASRFIAEVDSAAVYVNASTRFTDGGQLGLGAEVAISTQRLHARGPMGLRELTTYKWVIIGENHIRD